MNIRAANLPHTWVEQWNDTLITSMTGGAVTLCQDSGSTAHRWEHHSWQGKRTIDGRDALGAAIIDVIQAAHGCGMVRVTTDKDRKFFVPVHQLPIFEVEQ